MFVVRFKVAIFRSACTLINKKTKFSSYMYKKIQMGSGAKSYKRKGFLINEEMRKYLTIRI